MDLLAICDPVRARLASPRFAPEKLRKRPLDDDDDDDAGASSRLDFRVHPRVRRNAPCTAGIVIFYDGKVCLTPLSSLAPAGGGGERERDSSHLEFERDSRNG